uniref:Uncharacterized protein n=1 Tax=Tetraselmis chuii TaxID=63592 RepID=A0A7S1SKP9_9CHLO|mmetsp:Transcript_17413/g.31117  ORF Transcript_17413/g.31117 Transcript_17413/m.31117 type:complete len:436 (+) Transcript_17413:83-1390(+)
MFGGGFPFGGMPFGGMPGGMPEMPQRQKSDSTKYYELLGVNSNASAAELKKAHRKAAMQHHPDKGGDAETFRNINQAYDVLKDPEKREIYDKYGEDAIREGMADRGGGGGGMADIFDMFGGGGGGSRRERKAEDVMHRLKVSLEEMYNGATRKLSLSRNIKCVTCGGNGSKSGAPATCSQCHGGGTETLLRPLGPGMMQQIQQQCRKCRGSGRNVAPGDECNDCRSKGLKSEKHVFEVNIEKGMKNGQRIVLRGEAGVGNDPTVEPGNVVFQLEQKEHDSFKRVGDDLFLVHQLPLVDALCGGKIVFTQLDGRKLMIESKPGEVVKQDDWVCIEDEGMPHHTQPFMKGNMYVRFEVKFPEKLDAGLCAKLAEILPGDAGPSASDLEDAEEHDMKVVDIEEELKGRARERRSGAAYNSDSDEEGGPGGQRVQCAQQ